jgi:hypothetical protein
MGAHKSLLRSTKIRSAFLSTVQEVDVDVNGYTVTRLAFVVPVSLYQRVFERVTRGLYFFHTGKILPSDTPIQINLLTTAPDLSSPEMRMFAEYSVAQGAFEYRYILDHMESSNVVWLFAVHGSHWVQSSTGVLVKEAL